MAKITDKTLEIIHREYNVAVGEASSMQEIPEIMHRNLKDLKTDIPEEDASVFFSFMDGLVNCYRERKMTFEITDFVTELNSVVMYIIRWLNEEKQANIDINWYARRKALESDLTKILNKSLLDDDISVYIRDRFGIRGILLNKDTQKNNIEKIDIIFKAIKDILVRESPSKDAFVEWYQICPTINKINRFKLDAFLTDIPFAITDVRDYIHKPKANGYQSLQFTLQTSVYSPILPGAKIEFQLRDLDMHNKAEGYVVAESPEMDQSHKSYKNEIDERISNVFRIDDFAKVNLSGFINYDDKNADRDGLHHPKHFADRRSK